MTRTDPERRREQAERRRRREQAEAATRAEWAAHPGVKDKYESRLTCPECRLEFDGEWWGDKTADHRCPECGHVFEATWPGFVIFPHPEIEYTAPQTCPECGHEFEHRWLGVASLVNCPACGHRFEAIWPGPPTGTRRDLIVGSPEGFEYEETRRPGETYAAWFQRRHAGGPIRERNNP
jgi:DNA-directed RNA polymerase subunit RPC12/RpoP